MNDVGMLQPAGVTLYEYNSPGTLMSPNTNNKNLSRLLVHVLNDLSAPNPSSMLMNVATVTFRKMPAVLYLTRVFSQIKAA